MSIAGNCSTVTIMSIPAKCSMSKRKISFNQLAMELMADDFDLPSGVLEYKAGWTLALATSMTFTTLVANDGSWSEEEFLIFNCSDKLCFDLCKAFCLLIHVNKFKKYIVQHLCLALCYHSACCFSLRLFVKKFAVNRRFWKTPYQCEYQPVWKCQDSSEGKPDLFICWSSVEGSWCLSDNMGKKLASMDAKNIKFGFDSISLPDGHVAIPALNPSHGTNGIPKFRRVAAKLVDEYSKGKKRKALNAATSKAPPVRAAKAKALIPRGSVAKQTSGVQKPPEPVGPPPGHSSSGSSLAKASPAVPPQQKRERHGWLMKCKNLVVSYKNKDYHRFSELSKEQLADI